MARVGPTVDIWQFGLNGTGAVLSTTLCETAAQNIDVRSQGAGVNLRSLRGPQTLWQHRELHSQAMLASVVDGVRRFGPTEQQDDITLVVAECRGNSERN